MKSFRPRVVVAWVVSGWTGFRLWLPGSRLLVGFPPLSDAAASSPPAVRGNSAEQRRACQATSRRFLGRDSGSLPQGEKHEEFMRLRD